MGSVGAMRAVGAVGRRHGRSLARGAVAMRTPLLTGRAHHMALPVFLARSATTPLPRLKQEHILSSTESWHGTLRPKARNISESNQPVQCR